jgi:transposase
VAVGVEGCGSWGAGLARFLAANGVRVVEVNRPNRQNRRLRGKSDPVDAEAAARAVLSGEAKVTPKAGTGPVEAVRQLRVARSGAMKARIAASNQLHSLCDTAPDALRAQLHGLTARRKVAVCERWRPGTAHTPDAAAKRAMVSVARRWRALDEEVRELDAHLRAILDEIAAPLLARFGVGYESAGQLLVTAGDNPSA